MIAQGTAKSKIVLLEAYLEVRREYSEALQAKNGSRVARGYSIVRDEKISQVNSRTWLVTSSNGYTPYIVSFVISWGCSCKDCDTENGGHAPVIWFMGSYGPVCKHIVAAALCWLSKMELPQVILPANGRIYNRAITCETCQLRLQECDCPTGGNLPEPARVTTFVNINQPLTIGEQKQAARNSLGIRQEAGRQTSANLAIRRW
jgi:hypothetical protein